MRKKFFKSYDKEYSIEQLKNKVLYYINYRIRSEKEVSNKLKSLNASEENTTLIMDELRQLGLINDERFIGFFVRDYIENKKYGMSRVKIELKSKGFADYLIQDTLSEYLDEEEYNPIQEALSLITNKFKNKITDDQKILGYLARRGFPYSDAKKALDEYKRDTI